jgi:hypothetical protein
MPEIGQYVVIQRNFNSNYTKPYLFRKDEVYIITKTVDSIHEVQRINGPQPDFKLGLGPHRFKSSILDARVFDTLDEAQKSLDKSIGTVSSSGGSVVLSKGDTVEFKINSTVYTYKVEEDTYGCYLQNPNEANGRILQDLRISDKAGFVIEYSKERNKHVDSGSFPYCDTLIGLGRVVFRLHVLCTEETAKQLATSGVKSTIDSSAAISSHRAFVFKGKTYRFRMTDFNFHYTPAGDGNIRVLSDMAGIDRYALARSCEGYTGDGLCPTFKTREDLHEFGNKFQAKLSEMEWKAEGKVTPVEEKVEEPTYQYEYKSPVTFEVRGKKYKYEVHENYLYIDDSYNNTILIALGYTTKEQRTAFVTKCIGYQATLCDNGFPTWRADDRSAPDKIIAAIKKRCEEIDLEEALAAMAEDDDDCDIFLDDAVEDWDDDEDEDEEDLPYHRKYPLGSVQAFATGSGIFHYTVTKVGLKAYSHAYGNLFVVLGVDPYTFWRKNLPYTPVNYHEEVYGVIEGDAGYLDDAITALKALCKDHMEKYSLDCAKPTITPTSARASLAIPMDGLEVKELTVHNSIIL